MLDQFSRTRLILGKDNIEKLKNAKVLVFGIGGVGGHVVEGLVRSGIGHIAICDNDTVSLTNINRQLIATLKDVNRLKVDVMEERIHEINPDCIVEKFDCFYLPEEASKFDFKKYDYVVDCIDTVKAKIDIILRCKKDKVKIISSMGMGNKINPLDIEIADIYKTSVDPLAKVMRYELKKRKVDKLKVAFSKEAPLPIIDFSNDEKIKPGKQSIPGSTAVVPSVAGLIIAAEILKDLTGIKPRKGA